MRRRILAIVIAVLMVFPISASAKEFCNGNIEIDVPDGWDYKVGDYEIDDPDYPKYSYVKALSMYKGDQYIEMFYLTDYGADEEEDGVTDLIFKVYDIGSLDSSKGFNLETKDGKVLEKHELFIDGNKEPIYLYKGYTQTGNVAFIAGSIEKFNGTSEDEIAVIEKCLKSFEDKGYAAHIYDQYKERPKAHINIFETIWTNGWLLTLIIALVIFAVLKICLAIVKRRSIKEKEKNAVFDDDPLNRRYGSRKKIENGVFNGSLEEFYEAGYISHDEYLELVKRYREDENRS